MRVVVLASLAWLFVSSADAYCLATTDKPAECHAPCVETGEPLAWREATVRYSFREGSFGTLDEASTRRVFAESFAAWAAVQCEGKPLGFHFEAEEAFTRDTVGPRLAEPNANVLWLPNREQWEALGYADEAFAVTETWHDVTGKTIGRIRGADMSFNPRMGPWTECDGACLLGNDLRNVATHEIGHLLGLAHSDVAGSTMWCDAQGGETVKGDLLPDDAAGLCAAYEGIELAPKKPGDCSAGTGGTPWFAAPFVLALLMRRRRR